MSLFTCRISSARLISSICLPFRLLAAQDDFNYFSLVFLRILSLVSRHRRPHLFTHPIAHYLFRAMPTFSVILRGPSKCRANKNNLNIPKNRKNTYQHILIKNLESPSPMCSCNRRASPALARGKKRRKKTRTVYMFVPAQKINYKPSIHLRISRTFSSGLWSRAVWILLSSFYDVDPTAKTISYARVFDALLPAARDPTCYKENICDMFGFLRSVGFPENPPGNYFN